MKKFYFLLIAMMVGLVANAADYYALHGQITGNSNWESVLLTEKDGWYEYTGTFVAGDFGIKKVAEANAQSTQLAWIGGGANFTEADVELDFTEGGNSKSTLAGNYTFKYNPTTNKAVFTPYSGVITVTEVYALRGTLVSGSWEDYDMTEVDGKWTLTIENAVAGSFGIKRMENGSQKDWYAADGAATMAAAGEYPAKINGTNWNSTLTGKVSFSFDPATLVLTVTTDGGDDPEPPTPPTPSKDFYGLHGSIFGGEWQTVNFTNVDGVLTLTAAIVPGEFGVKVMDENGNQLEGAAGWLASPTGETVSAAGTYAVGSGSNFTSTLEGQYKVTFDPTAMTLTFAEDDTPIEHVITYALRGTLVTGEWEDYSMTEVAEGWYVTLSVTAGDESAFGIKKMDNGVQTNWYAAPEATTIAEAGSYKATGLGGSNWVCALEGTYTFVFDPETETLKVWKGTLGVENVAADNAPVEYYNLQGVRVNNPENGIFIRRQGNNVTKVIR